MSDLRSVLKPNATAAERAIEAAIRAADPDLTPIASLMDPMTCPAHLLGWLAWAFSVDVWEPTWSEAHKRDVILQSVALHRRKGTVGAVRRALATIGFQIEIAEWFDTADAPHTFRIDAFGDDIFDAGFLINPRLVAMVRDLIENVKPVRSHYTLRIGERRRGPVMVRAGHAGCIRDRRAVAPSLPVDAHVRAVNVRTGHRSATVSRQVHSLSSGGAP